MTDVFISYARSDRNRVRLIAHGLAAEGFAVWWDPEIRPGKKWNDAIRRALDSSAAVVTCWSRTSAKSDWVAAETQSGHARQAMVPVMIQRCTPPIPYNMIQSADLTHWKGDADDAEWMAVLRQVRALVEAKRRMVAAAPPPGEAHGMQGAAGAIEQSVGHYRMSGTRGRVAPRASRFALGAVVATVVVTGGLWVGQALLPSIGVIEPPPPPKPVATAPTPAAPPPASTTAPPPAAAPTTPAAPAPSPPAAPAPTPTPPADDSASLGRLDGCASGFAKLCPQAAGGAQPAGFAPDGRLTTAEQGFLGGLRFPSQRPVTQETAGACEARLAEAAALRRRQSGSLLSTACSALSWPQPTPTPPSGQPPSTSQPPVSTRPPTVGATPTTATPTSGLAEAETCAAALARRCPSPQPTAGLAVDGRLSRTETTLLAAVAPNASTAAEQAKLCEASLSLRQTPTTLLSACRTLSGGLSVSPAALKDLTTATRPATTSTPSGATSSTTVTRAPATTVLRPQTTVAAQPPVAPTTQDPPK
jgi:hypothetical protein